jgi:type I restriction enzyme S subunit
MTNSWVEKPLNDLGFLGRGKSRHRPRNAPFLYNGPYPFIQTADITNSELHVLDYSQTYSEAGLAQSKLWEPGTLCIVNAGVNTGDTAILAFKACFPDSVIGFVADDEKCDVRFIKYFLHSIKNQIRQVTMGATQDNLSVSKLLSFRVPAPHVDTQRKIAAILSAYDDLIENNLRRIKILEEMAQNLYREWFVKFRFPGHQHARFTDSPLGRIPEGWEVVSLGKITELRKDKFKKKLHSECPLLDLAKMQQRTLSVGETGSPDELTTSRIIFEEDDILFGSIRPYLHKVALAPYRGITNVSVLVIRPAEKSLQSFLTVLLSSIDTIRWADQHSTGTKMPLIKWEALQTMPVLMPTQAVLRAFETSVQPMLQTVKMTSSRNQTLRRTRDLLLPRLISGEVDVSELDIAVSEESSA